MADGSWPYPTIDKPLPLADGDSVHLYSIIIVQRLSGKKSASLHYGTRIATRAQAESRELSSESIPLARAPDGSWRADVERKD